MKKRLAALFVLLSVLLVACSEEADTTEQASSKAIQNTSEEKASTATSKDNELKQVHYAQYHNVLAEAIDSYGHMPDSGNVLIDPINSGVFYTELIDFDQDGMEELYVILKGDGTQTSQYAHRNTENYVQEVWSGNPSGDTPVLSFSSEISAGDCAACDMSVSIIDDLQGKTYLYTHNHHTGQGYVNDEQYVYTKSNSSSLDEKSFIIDGDSFTVDGQEVEQNTYLTELEKYTQNERPIIISEGGPKKFAFLPYGAADISDMLVTLSQYNNDFVGKKGNAQDQQSTIEKAFEQETNTRFLDVRSKENEKYLVQKVLLEGDLPSEYDGANPAYVKFTEQDVLNAVEQRYAVRLNLEDTLIHATSYSPELVTYENGYFNLLVTDFSELQIERAITAIHKVAKDLYYVELLDDEYDTDAYYYETMDETDIVTTNKDSLPAEALNYIKTGIKRFAVVKVVNGDPKIQYIGAKNLTKQEIKAYK